MLKRKSDSVDHKKKLKSSGLMHTDLEVYEKKM